MKKDKLQFDAKITLMLREQDVALLLNSIRGYTPINKDEEENRKYLLDLLELYHFHSRKSPNKIRQVLKPGK